MRTPKLKVKGILLDLDGTIVDSKDAYIRATEIAFAAIGKVPIESNIALEIPKRLEQNLPLDDMLRGIDTKRFLEVYLDAYYQATSTQTKPILSISRTLEKLSEKARLAVITMRHVPKKRVCEELERFGLAKYFLQVMTALDTRDPKPSPEVIIKCAKQLGIKTCECAVVGDSVADIRAGKTAGTRTIAVLSGIFSRAELEKEKPDLIIKNINALPNYIR